jgi:hypothetical protein
MQVTRIHRQKGDVYMAVTRNKRFLHHQEAFAGLSGRLVLAGGLPFPKPVTVQSLVSALSV